MKDMINLIFYVLLFCAGLAFVALVGREVSVIYLDASQTLNEAREKQDILLSDILGVKKNLSLAVQEKDKFENLSKRQVFTSLNRLKLMDTLRKIAKDNHIGRLDIEIQPDQIKEQLGVRSRTTSVELKFNAQTDREVWMFAEELKKHLPGIVRINFFNIERGEKVSVAGGMTVLITKLKVLRS